jgi:hypothetical protein
MYPQNCAFYLYTNSYSPTMVAYESTHVTAFRFYCKWLLCLTDIYWHLLDTVWVVYNTASRRARNLHAGSRTSLVTDRHARICFRILGQCNALPYLHHAASCGQVLLYVSWRYCINLAAPFSEITPFVSYTTKLPATFLSMFIDSADNVHRYMTPFLFLF